MKKLFFIPFITACMLLFVFKAEAGNLTIRMYDNSPFDIIFNGQLYRNVHGSITFSHFRPGRNHIKIFKYTYYPNGSISAHPRVVFDGMVRLRADREVFAMIDRFGRYIVEEEYIISHAPNHPAPPVYAPPYMSDYDFMHLRASIVRLSFDSSRLNLAKQGVSSNIVTAAQVRELMSLLTFESNRLELAKFAYHYTFDKHRYFIVNDAFTFSSSIRSLDRYISGV